MKKKMKQLAVLGMAMLLVLTGCAGKTEDTSEEIPEVEIEVEEIPEATPTGEPEKEEVPLSINISRNQKTYYSEDGSKDYLYLQYCDVTIEGSGYEDLKRTTEKWSMERSEGLRTLADDLAEDAAADAEESEQFYGYNLYHTVETARADERIVSLLDDTYQYMGAAHGNYFREGINFDAKTGKRLALSDIITDYENFTVEAKERIVGELTKNYAEDLFDDYQQHVEDLWAEGAEPEWYLDATGIVIVLQEYAVGAYVMGRPEIHLPYTEFEYYIKENYLPGIFEGVARLEKNQELYVQLSEDSEELPMMLKYEWNDGMAACTLWFGNDKRELGEFSSLNAAYLIRSGDEVFCMVETDMASDDYVTYVYRLTESVIQEIDQIGASIDKGNINSREMIMESWVYLLGTYSGIKNYTLDEEEGFSTEDTEYRLYRNEYALTTIADIPVTLDGEESILPAGSRIVLNATDGDTYVKFTIQGTGQTGVMEVSRDEEEYYQVTIHGMSEYDCFEDLPYAG